jgi:hypothetical protein
VTILGVGSGARDDLMTLGFVNQQARRARASGPLTPWSSSSPKLKALKGSFGHAVLDRVLRPDAGSRAVAGSVRPLDRGRGVGCFCRSAAAVRAPLKPSGRDGRTHIAVNSQEFKIAVLLITCFAQSCLLRAQCCLLRAARLISPSFLRSAKAIEIIPIERGEMPTCQGGPDLCSAAWLPKRRPYGFLQSTVRDLGSLAG